MKSFYKEPFGIWFYGREKIQVYLLNGLIIKGVLEDVGDEFIVVNNKAGNNLIVLDKIVSIIKQYGYSDEDWG